MAKVRVTLEEIEARRAAQYGKERDVWMRGTAIEGLMQPERRGGKVAKRPIGPRPDAFLQKCPGSSQHAGVDFVRAVYAERTGQE